MPERIWPIRSYAEVAADLLAERDRLARRCEELEAERETWMRQRWSYQNRAEVAERGHKAALARLAALAAEEAE